MKTFFSPFNPFDAAAEMASKTLWSEDDPTPCPDWIAGLVGGHYREFLGTIVPGKTIVPDQADFDSSLFHPHAIRYVMNSRGRQTHPGEQAFAPWLVELARFDVPRGYTGIVRSFEQYAAAAGLAGWTVVDTVGNPFADVDAGVSGSWVCRLTPFDGRALPWVSVLNPPGLPGIPYPDMPDTIGIWYPAGSDAAQNVRLTVPGGFSLRVFWQCDSLDVQPAVALSLKGSIQGSYTPRFLDYTRGQWQ